MKNKNQEEERLIKGIDRALLKWKKEVYKEYSVFLEIYKKWKLFKKLRKGVEK